VHAGVELLEGSYALGLRNGEQPARRPAADGLVLQSRQSGLLVAAWPLRGFDSTDVAQVFDDSGRHDLNVIHPANAVITLLGQVTAQAITLASIYYASPKPLPPDELQARARAFIDASLQAISAT
jgi:hypothetical protein